MNLILQAIKSLFRKLENKIDRDIVNNRSDWEQNDENGAGYVKNRTHYIEDKEVIPSETVIEENLISINFLSNLLIDEVYTINFNGKIYEQKIFFHSIF